MDSEVCLIQKRYVYVDQVMIVDRMSDVQWFVPWCPAVALAACGAPATCSWTTRASTYSL